MTSKTYWRGVNVGVLGPQLNDMEEAFNNGANLVRVILFPWDANDIDAETFKVRIRDQLNLLDARFPTLPTNKKFCLEIHLPPGGVNAEGKARMWIDRPWGLTCLRETWVEIADRYKNSPHMHVFDILNEPACPNNDKIQAMYVDVIKAVRKVNTAARIAVSQAYGNIPTTPPFSKIIALNDKKIWYQVHVYKPMTFSHQGVYPQYPVGPQYPTATVNKAKLKSWLGVMRKFQTKYRANIFCGEFCASIYAENPDAIQYMSDIISLCEEWGWQWCHLSWDHQGPWNTFRSPQYLETLKAALAKNG